MAALWAEFSEPEEAVDRRGSARRALRLVARAAQIRTINEVLILDLSTTGLMIETGARLSSGETIEVELPGTEPIAARVVWRRDAYYGCEFLSQAPVAAVSAALLRSAPNQDNIFVPAAAAPGNTFSGAKPPSRNEPIGRSLALLVLTMLLVAVGTFALALLTLPLSAH